MHTKSDLQKALILAVTLSSVTSGALSQAADAGEEATQTSMFGVKNQKTTGTFSYPTMINKSISLPTTTARLTPRIGISGQNELPPCKLDSFVRSAGAMADLIYGDEGTDGPPPYSSFTQIHRIEAGIFGDTREGLTTGHRTILPSSWGNDEFLGAE